ncbi:MAG: ferritin family protein [Candidatus Brocadiia bacterium]
MKMKILIMDATGVVAGPLSAEMKAEGWTTRTCAAPKKLPKTAGGCDGVFLAVAAGELAARLPGAIRLARKSGAALLLATNLDRSGWDRTFESADALEVDALFDLPVEPAAVVRRLKGIAEARGRAEPEARKTPAGASIIARAVANEEAAQAFYARAAKSVTRKDTKEALESLARDEKEHKRLLTEFKKGRGALPSEPAAGGSVLESASAPDFSPDMTPADAFLLAARKEKLAADFYESWASMYPEGPERELLHRLAEVERRHKAWVEGMFTNASFPERW